ncbi:conserved protein of unknown function [Rhodovastum atsumiense]|uniref:Uncharacterized protein n=1 Tax=Rhodovastum atsumiense TaxID=504468 RepID=A0A5M6ILL6_9PROT|nr:hypothetical protein [Rhodovastum atsumiense]KAA5609171.1 hypothetical protein F1189_25400 [Rhodovastum atsumiense]CAH2602849.1 conserved protein of unknown function [Rhodovastum atsumiense]
MILFIDIEASSLNADSHPIELGWCGVDGRGESHLIKPPRAWKDWSVASEYVHGLSRRQLRTEGRPPQDVARRAVEVLGQPEVTVYSDAPPFDGRWLDVLLVRCGYPPGCVAIRDVHHAYVIACLPLLAALPPDDAADRAAAEAEIRAVAARLIAEAEEAESRRPRIRHRALADAEGLAWTWREIRRLALAHAGRDA